MEALSPVRNGLLGYRSSGEIEGETKWSISTAGSVNLMRVAVHSFGF